MKTQTLGSIRVEKLIDIEPTPLDGFWLFGNLTPDIVEANRDWLGRDFIEEGSCRLMMSFHSYVIRMSGLTILIDTCVGNHKPRPGMPAWDMLDQPRYIERLAAMGLAPQDIDIVMCTHLHADHVGWNTRLENGHWVPTFPKARYLMSRADYVHYEGLHRAGPVQPVNRGSFADSVLPVIEHGQATLVAAGDRVDANLGDEIWIESAPGHTIGNLNIFLRSAGRSACFCSDVIHHPLQCAHPELYNNADYDKKQAADTRLKLLHRCADSDVVVLTGHFPDPTAGRIVRHGDTFRFLFER